MIHNVFSRIGPVAALAALLMTLTSGVHAQTREASSSGELLDRVAATVNEGVVLQSELEEQMVVISERLREQKL